MVDSKVSHVRRIRFWQHELSGTLTVIPDSGDNALEMPVRRVFTLTKVPVGGVRGDHAHRFCTQVVVCLHGRVSVELDDGERTETTTLDDPSAGISIPPGIWNRITFELPGTVLAVFCDQLYDPSDYLRDRKEFEAHKRSR